MALGVNGNIRLQSPESAPRRDDSRQLGSDELIWNETQKICTIMNEYPGFIFNLGHGVLPKTPIDNVKQLINKIRGNL